MSETAQNHTLAPVDAPAEEVHVLEWLQVLYKRRWAAITVMVIVVLTAVVHSFTATPIFEARTRLLIENADQNIVNFKAVVEEGESTADYYQTQYGILQSRGLARRTIERLNLWNSPQLGGPKTPEEAKAAANEDQTTRESRVIDSFIGHLSVEPIKNSRLVDVKFSSDNPDVAARIANGIAASYIEQTLEFKYTASQDATGWLAERLKEQKKQVEVAETALQRYRERNDAISLEDRENIVVQKLADLNTAVTRAKTERLQREAVERQLREIERDAAKLDTFPAILGNPFIQRLKTELSELQRKQVQMSEQLGPRHPEMTELRATIQNAQSKLTAEIGKVVQSVHTEYEAALAQERSLVGALEQQKSEALAMNRKAIEYSVLARDVESGKQIYESLLQRAKETDVSGELRTSNIRVVDEAETPQRPASPKKVRDVALSGFVGFILAVAVALLFEYIDSRIKSPDEIKACLGLASLGIIPELRIPGTASPLLSNGNLPGTFSETIRTLRTNIVFSSPDDGPRTLAITSTGPGEGKTVVATNLAIAFAMSGQRVLIVDADLRRPRVHSALGIEQEPGLSNVLVGETPTSEAVKKSDIANLWTLSAGRTPPNPAELLGSQKFEDLLKTLSARFDTIIIDTPPVMVVADPTVVANVTSGVVFVVGSEMTSRQTARTAIEQLQRGRARLIGAVLNRAQIEKDSYYYSRYYRREYASYYHTAAS